MKNIRINGVAEDVSSDQVFEDFLNDLRTGLRGENKIIASVRVNGRELSENEEALLKQRKLKEMGEVEVFTSSPAELAYETLNTLGQFIDLILNSIRHAADAYSRKNLVAGDSYFAKGIDGLDLFVQTIGGVKQAMSIGLNPKLALQEATMISIMQDLLQAKREHNYVFLVELLSEDLVENLLGWRDDIVPMLKGFSVS
ncbi:MAG: hypothetical protein AB7F43_02850 [Bacteriovoracia bacterium]